jgi:hypothetical protein
MMIQSRWNSRTQKLLVVTASAAIAFASLLHPQRANAAASDYRILNQAIEVNGVRSSLSALNTDNTTYIAIRSLNNSIGLTTDWDQAKQVVTVSGRDRELALNLKDGSATLNGQQIYGLPAIVQNNTTYVPFRFLLERMGFGVAYDSSTKVIGIEAIKENDLKITTEVIREKSSDKSLAIHYPQLSGLVSKEAEKKINETLKSDAELNAEVARGSLEQALGDGDFKPTMPVSFEGTYTITYNEQGKLSLYVDYYIYTGGAHGSTARVPYTFDLSSGKIVTLKEAALGKENYVAIINARIQSQIKARGIQMLNPFKTIEPDRDYFLKHNGVVVYFGQYEYTPYAEGMPEFEIPFSDFK